MGAGRAEGAGGRATLCRVVPLMCVAAMPVGAQTATRFSNSCPGAGEAGRGWGEEKARDFIRLASHTFFSEASGKHGAGGGGDCAPFRTASAACPRCARA